MSKDKRPRAELGDRVKDLLTDFKGIVIEEINCLTGPRRLTVQPKELREGRVQKTETFEEDRWFVITRRAVVADGEQR